MTDNKPSIENKRFFPIALSRALTPVAVILAILVAGFQYFHSLESNEKMDQLAVSSAAPSKDSPQELKAGVTIPDIPLKTLGGKNTQFSKLGAKVTLITFWATWCAPCMTEMPSIEKLYQRYKAQGLEVVAVNLDEKPDSVVPKTIKKLGISFQIYVDTDQNLANLFDIQGIPLTLVIDKNRKVLELEGGERDWNDTQMQSKMKTWLGT